VPASLVTVASIAIVGALALLVAQALVNTWYVKRLDAMPMAGEIRVAVLVPARNEAARIAACVRGWLAQRYDPFSVLVYDDDSSDGTSAVARAAAAGDVRLRIIPGGPLPAGWRGKPHACHRLRGATNADVMIFADADVVPHPDAVSHTVGALRATGADVVSALPWHETRRVSMQAVVGLQRWAALTLVPWWLARYRGAPRLAVLNGQYVAMTGSVYDAVGGFAAVRGSLAEDVALGRRLAAHGHRPLLVDAATLLTCRPYETLGDVWNANVRNLSAAVLGSSALAVGGAAALVLLHLFPVVALLAGSTRSPAWPWAPLAALALAVLSRRIADRGTRAGLGVALLHPAAVTLLAVMLLESWRRARRGLDIEWRGRHYRASDVTG